MAATTSRPRPPEPGRRRTGRRLGLAPLLLVAACATSMQPMGPARHQPALTAHDLVAADGFELPLREWQPPVGPPPAGPRAVVIALHGFNDYSEAFDAPGPALAAAGIITYAYDQRGFGSAGKAGVWASTDTLIADLYAAVAAVRRRHPGLPIHLLGESMGGAVILAALGEPPPPGRAPLAGQVASAILAAPAAWSRKQLPFSYRAALWLAVNTVPGLRLSPPRDLHIIPSDNFAMLRALSRDPLVIKETRVDAISGLVRLMSRAAAAIPHLPDLPVLLMYGRHEQVLPKASVATAIARFRQAPDPRHDHRVAVYRQGYHMLLRDLDGPTVWRDVAAWIADPGHPLPSGADQVPWTGDSDRVADQPAPAAPG